MTIPAPRRPLIDPVPPAAEADKVEAIFAAVRDQLGFVPDGLRLYAISPPLLEAFLGMVGYLRSEASGLPSAVGVMIRYLLSAQAECPFCIDMNEAMLLGMGFERDALLAARRDPEQAPVDEKALPLIRLAMKAVADPHAVAQADLDAARAQGWPDRVLFDTVVLATTNRAFTSLLGTFKIEHQGAWG